MDDPQKVAQIFKALSSETRVCILRMLKQRALCVGALAARLDITSAAVSQHLRILRDADLVVPDKRGYYVHYLLNRETLEQWRQVADDLLTADEE
jgi:DNA-binding transcriptional ArsR family regulator